MIKKKDLFTNGEMTRSDRCLHTPGSFARQNLLYVQEVGTLQSLQPHRCVRENLDSFLLMTVTEGRGSLEIAGRHIEMKKGDCVWIDCMEHYEHISDADDAWSLAWVHFNGKQARSFYQLFLEYNQNNNWFSASDADGLVDIIKELRSRQTEKNLLSEIACGELLTHLIYMVLEAVAKNGTLESESEKQTARAIREYINEQYVEKNINALLEDAFARSPEELNEVFVRMYGITLEEYIVNRRYNAAKELLRFSVKPIEAVAEEAGIEDLAAMQRLFRDNDAMSAEEYRKRWAGWIRN